MQERALGRHARLAARGESPAAFGRRCIPPGGVAPRSNTPGILTRRALPSGRIAALGATPDFHHGLLRARGAGSGRRTFAERLYTAGVRDALVMAAVFVATTMVSSAAFAGQEVARPTFAEWLAGVRTEALSRGIRQDIVDQALTTVEEPVREVLDRDH